MRKTFSFLGLLWLCSALGLVDVHAQKYYYAFEHYTTDNGLRHDEVFCIWKDHRGFMWFGTLNGLNRFDGGSFKTCRREQNDVQGLPSTNGNLWAAMCYWLKITIFQYKSPNGLMSAVFPYING